jgi:acid phosphatase (class A)
MTRSLFWGAAALALIAVPALAQNPSMKSMSAKPKKVLVLVTPEEVDPRRIVPPPPEEGSDRALADIAEVHRVIAAASPERMAQAKWDDDHESPELLSPTLGPAFDLKALPATAELLSLVQNDADVAASMAKHTFPRKRPWAADATIKTCDPDDKPLTSYPSGHATLGYSLALTMAAVAPEKAQALLARAADYAYSREVCGSHFADDAQASEALATALVSTLLTKPAFQSKIAAARAELTAKGLISQ